MAHVDRISHLPEALLLRILSELPTTKDVLATMVLSKQWEHLWKSVPKLVYNDSCQNIYDTGRFSCFVDRSLILHEAPVETLHFKLTQKSLAVNDIGVWITIAVKCGVRDMIINIDCYSCTTPVILPRSLYKGSRMLVSLKLNSVTLMDVSSLPSFPTLKTLSLVSVKYPGDEFVRRFLSSCPVLEALRVEQRPDDNVTIFTVKVPSLKSATLYKSARRCTESEDGFVVDAPSLEYLNICFRPVGFCVIEDMPKIVKANVTAYHSSSGVTLTSFTSAKRLSICLPYSKDAYSVGTVFHRLVRLRIFTYKTEWLNLLMCLLNDSPNLRHLKLQKCHEIELARPCWNDPSSVPECLSSSLETLEWEGYEGRKEDKEVVAFILRSGRCLKKVTISSKSTDSDKKLEMLKELSLSFRRSPTCQLAFD
ncbi:putative FBD-associated F-box protein [Raphanus sativus]|uniref:Probable FBD-associated F-box protein At1g32375 n=1 Tax=Raphanus sativus TaxID=3726 RepID=A0A6J0MP10_RAPSA|nr:probable FBD-associated F-box protein At1g32375 [Raphanus sativus]XP_056856441.1 probable FBD-associated F-box protein At1g32375 [Raphanus sativus]KAJ4867607.1 putative FBD-associated F-box protein [Raphanus sativus]KAJ4907721.1 putative FBD-associated F-box protein [Raphanus sativus]